ncbi:hypothetical protein IF2G_04704 [Cordyceps javanica]|nr:hypothetical protein IF2G_04704 [Cordyceps javanica]
MRAVRGGAKSDERCKQQQTTPVVEAGTSQRPENRRMNKKYIYKYLSLQRMARARNEPFTVYRAGAWLVCDDTVAQVPLAPIVGLFRLGPDGTPTSRSQLSNSMSPATTTTPGGLAFGVWGGCVGDARMRDELPRGGEQAMDNSRERMVDDKD